MSDISDKFSSGSGKGKTGGLERKLSGSTPFLRKIWDVAKAVPLYGAAVALGGSPVAISAALGGGVYVAGYSVESITRKNIKWRWRDAYKEFVMGSLFGGASYGFFEGFKGLESATAGDKWIKTAKYVGLSTGAGIPVYRGVVYLREEVGLYKSLTGIFNGKTKQYVKDAWNYDIKKNWPKMAFRTAAVITLPIHYILNYVPGGSVAKVAAQKVLTFANRLILGGKASIQKYDPNKVAYGT